MAKQDVFAFKCQIATWQKGVNMNKAKSYDELTIRDSFMFGKICSKPENRKLILDSLLQIDFQEKTGEIEKQIREYRDAKYVRLDLLAKDESDTIYNAEMQNKSANGNTQKELPKRSRYYQSIIDTTTLRAGESYLNLPESFIIFICTYDPFGEGLPIYSFDTKCNESNVVKYEDLAHKIFFNTTADLTGLPISMKNMLIYINNGVANDTATKTLDSEIYDARLKEEWRTEYMLTLTYRDEIYAEGRTEGRAEGFAEGCASKQAEIDNLNAVIAELNNLGDERVQHILKEFENNKKIDI